MKKTVLLFFLFLMVFPAWMPQEVWAGEPMKVGLVTDMGKIDDKTFNEHAYKGMMKAAEEFGLKTSFIETRQPLLTLHGHVHESARLTGAWNDRIGRTWLFGGAHDGPELALVRFDPEDLEGASRLLL